jgi:hypothetical protein
MGIILCSPLSPIREHKTEGQRRKIERSAEALRGVPPPDHLSLQKKPCYNAVTVTPRTKSKGVALKV